MATIKTNNYLPNALSADDAEADLHATHGIFVDEEGFVSEGGTFNVGFITKDNELVVPEFDNCLAGVTIQRIMELVPQARPPSLPTLKLSCVPACICLSSCLVTVALMSVCLFGTVLRSPFGLPRPL